MARGTPTPSGCPMVSLGNEIIKGNGNQKTCAVGFSRGEKIYPHPPLAGGWRICARVGLASGAAGHRLDGLDSRHRLPVSKLRTGSISLHADADRNQQTPWAGARLL